MDHDQIIESWRNVAKGAALYAQMAISRKDWGALKEAQKILRQAQDHAGGEGALMRSIYGSSDVPQVSGDTLTALMAVGKKATKEEVKEAHAWINTYDNRYEPLPKTLTIYKSASGWSAPGWDVSWSISGDPIGLATGIKEYQMIEVEVLGRAPDGLLTRYKPE